MFEAWHWNCSSLSDRPRCPRCPRCPGCPRHACGVAVASVAPGVVCEMPSYSSTPKLQWWGAEQPLGPTFPTHSHRGCHGICCCEMGSAGSTSSSCSTEFVSWLSTGSARAGRRTLSNGQTHCPLGAEDAKDTASASGTRQRFQCWWHWREWCPCGFSCTFCASISCLGKGATFGEVSLQHRSAHGPIDFSQEAWVAKEPLSQLEEIFFINFIRESCQILWQALTRHPGPEGYEGIKIDAAREERWCVHTGAEGCL